MKALFLDRDGVINVENEGGYILRQEDFEFLPGVPEAMAILRKHFDLFLVVTNQRCVGRKLIAVEDLEAMHHHMVREIEGQGGKIDRVYYAPALDRDDPYRKPNTGMGRQALKDFPKIDLSRSAIVGNNLSDMQFGKSLGLQTVFLSTTSEAYTLPHDLIDRQFPSLLEYALSL